jgi:hypothetical protein
VEQLQGAVAESVFDRGLVTEEPTARELIQVTLVVLNPQTLSKLGRVSHVSASWWPGRGSTAGSTTAT